MNVILKNSQALKVSNDGTAYSILITCGIGHFLNDMIQSVIPSIYPVIKDTYGFSFAQIGIITLVFQMTSSILQPFTGYYADKRPTPYALSIGMCFTLTGLLMLSGASTFLTILAAVGIIGMGSSIFHPEASRVTQMASGGKKSLAQAIFQVGGNSGNALGPLLAALIVLPFGQSSIRWFALIAILSAVILLYVASWYKERIATHTDHPQINASIRNDIPSHKVHTAMLILVALIFSKYFYLSCMTSYFTFFLMDKFSMTVQNSQLCLFAFLAASALGTIVGGLLGDKYGRKYIIWGSILGAAPFALLLPHVNCFWTITLAVIIGLVISSAFSSIVVYATDLMPDRIGMISGVFFGLMFGLGGIGSAFFGWLADKTSIWFIFNASAYLPLLGIVAGFLPDTRKKP